MCLGTTEGPRGTEERLHHNARKLCGIFWIALGIPPGHCVARVAREVEEVMQTALPPLTSALMVAAGTGCGPDPVG